MPACAKPYAIAIEPSAVTTHDNSEIAPTFAMFVGNMMMPEPIMLIATMNVSCTTFIFFGVRLAISPPKVVPTHTTSVQGRSIASLPVISEPIGLWNLRRQS